MQYDQGRGFVAAISRADAIIAFAIIIQAVMCESAVGTAWHVRREETEEGKHER